MQIHSLNTTLCANQLHVSAIHSHHQVEQTMFAAQLTSIDKGE